MKRYFLIVLILALLEPSTMTNSLANDLPANGRKRIRVVLLIDKLDAEPVFPIGIEDQVRDQARRAARDSCDW